jgi:hypothetical protein
MAAGLAVVLATRIDLAQETLAREHDAVRHDLALGNGGAEISSEFTITETIGPSAMLYSVLYALELGCGGLMFR